MGVIAIYDINPITAFIVFTLSSKELYKDNIMPRMQENILN